MEEKNPNNANNVENELIIQKESEISPLYADDSKSFPTILKEKITTALSNITETKIVKVLSELANTEEIRKEVTKVINKETTYIARIPKKLKADMQMGLLDFMHDKKTGENLGMLVDSKHKTKGYLRIDEANSVDLTANLANIAIQQQLANMTEVINDVRSRVISLQEGHDADLFGSIKGMHHQLLQMRDAKNPETRKQLATNAITVINDIRGKLEMTILNVLKDIELVPGTDRAIYWEITKNKNYLSDIIEKYDRVEELFSYYITATQLLGYTYAFLDEPLSYNDVFLPCKELVENENLKKLIAAEYIYEETLNEKWYKNPEKYLVKIENASHDIFLENNDIVEIEITGEKVLEAIENGNESSKENCEEEISDC